jgi:hypothetical protein
VLSLHEDIPAVGRGVGEGSIRFEGEATESVVELEQPRGIRRLVQLQIFDGPDKYREPLLEDTGSGRQPLNELSFVRVEARPVAPAPGVERAMIELPESWKPFEPLVRGNWESDGAQAGGALRVRTTFDWEPSLEMILARTSAVNAEGAATPLFEAFIYRQVRSPALRCLVLSHRGAVHEGDVSVLDGGALQAELKLFEDARGVPQLARFEIEGDGRLRTRVWSLEGAERTLALDVAMKPAEP